jgi:hypothetical protein
VFLGNPFLQVVDTVSVTFKSDEAFWFALTSEFGRKKSKLHLEFELLKQGIEESVSMTGLER